MAQNFANANEVLKEGYTDLAESLNNSSLLLAQIETDTRRVEARGKRARHPVHTRRSGAVGARAEGESLPTPRHQSYVEVLVPVRRVYSRILVDNALIEAMAGGDNAAYVDAVDSEMMGVENDLKVDVNRQVAGTSDGVIAVCGTTSASTTVQLATTTTARQMRQVYFDGGSVIDIGTVAAPTTIASARLVTASDDVNKTITISGAAVTTSSSHRIFRSGNGGASDNSGTVNDGQREITGLQTIISDTTVLHTLDPSTVGNKWKAKKFSGSGGTNRPVTENLVITAMQDRDVAAVAKVDLLLSNAGVHRAMFNHLQGMRRQTDTVQLKGGYEGLAIGAPGEGVNTSGRRAALCWERDVPEEIMWGIPTSELVKYQLKDWGWIDRDGTILLRYGDTDSYEARFGAYFDVAARTRDGFFVIEDLTEA